MRSLWKPFQFNPTATGVEHLGQSQRRLGDGVIVWQTSDFARTESELCDKLHEPWQERTSVIANRAVRPARPCHDLVRCPHVRLHESTMQCWPGRCFRAGLLKSFFELTESRIGQDPF